jgi:hypothetical protein
VIVAVDDAAAPFLRADVWPSVCDRLAILLRVGVERTHHVRDSGVSS